MSTPNFTQRDMDAFQSDSLGYAGISFTPQQIQKILEANPNGRIDALWEDFESCGHAGEYGMDTASRDIWLSAVAFYFTGRDWPIYGDGPIVANTFYRDLDIKLNEAGIQHTI